MEEVKYHNKLLKASEFFKLKRLIHYVFRGIYKVEYLIISRCMILFWRFKGPPRILSFSSRFNKDILRAFGAEISNERTNLESPIILANLPTRGSKAYENLTIKTRCCLNGNNYFDLNSKITLEDGFANL